MERDDLRRWVEARRFVEILGQRPGGPPPDPRQSWQQGLSLLGLLGRTVGWPVPADDIRRRDDAVAVEAWTRLRATFLHRR